MSGICFQRRIIGNVFVQRLQTFFPVTFLNVRYILFEHFLHLCCRQSVGRRRETDLMLATGLSARSAAHIAVRQSPNT